MSPSFQRPRVEPQPLPPPPTGDVSDAAIAAFRPETITMLNSHKYWSAERGALVDGLYEVWLDKKRRGADVEDVRQQIAWALKGVFMEDY